MQVLAWLGQFSGVIGKFFDYLSQENRRVSANQEKHLSDLKSGVIHPIISQLENYYTLACSEHAPLIAISNEITSVKPESVTQQIRSRTVYKIRACDHRYQPSAFSFVPTPAPDINLELYRDCKTNHYPGLIDEWEAFLHSFREIVLRCVKMAEEEVKRLAENAALPQSLASDPYYHQAINYVRLGVFITQRLMERSFYVLVIERVHGVDLWKLKIDSQDVGFSADKSVLEKVVAEIDRGVAIHRAAAADIDLQLKTLGQGIPGLLGQFKREALSHKKLMDCDLVG